MAAFSQQLLEAREEIKSLTTETSKVEEENNASEDQQKNNSFAVSSRADSGGKNKLVGFDDQIMQLRYHVLSGSSEIRIMRFFGMAGIGKTALVKEVYYDPLVIEHFDHRLFVTIGPQFQLKEFLLLALEQVGVNFDKMQEIVYTEQSLGENFCNSLKDDDNGSRIIFTSRLFHVCPDATYRIMMRLLNEDESWNLLHDMVCTIEEQCSPQLEKIGRKIAKNCDGLPLAILETGEIRRKTDKTVEKCNKIAENEDHLFITADDRTPLSKALYLSYRMLPQYLKVGSIALQNN